MTRTNLVRAWMIAAAVAAAIPAATLSAASSEETGTIKDITCRAAGCSKGDRKCADIEGEISDPLGTAKLAVTWYCYEGGAEL